MKHLSVFRRWMHTVRQLRLALLGLTLLFVTLVFSTLDFTLQLNRYTIASSQDSLQNTARSSIATLESYPERQLSYVQRAATAIASLPEGSSEAEVRQQLVDLGADYLQGFYYTMPLDEAGLRRFLHGDGV